MNTIKIDFVVCLIVLFGFVSCNYNGQNKQLSEESALPLETNISYVLNGSDLIDSVDFYVNHIRENGDLLDIRRVVTSAGQAVICSLDGNMVKVSLLVDSSNIVDTEYYVKDLKPVFMNRTLVSDVDLSQLETAYYSDGKVFKCFCNGNEITNIDSVMLISNLEEFHVVAGF